MAAENERVMPMTVPAEPVPPQPRLTTRPDDDDDDNTWTKTPAEETFRGRLVRRARENPLVPVGCVGTAGALLYGLRAFHQGNERRSQAMMRLRLLAQGFTVAAFMLGILVNPLKPRR